MSGSTRDYTDRLFGYADVETRSHCICFTRSRLTISKNGGIVAFETSKQKV